MGELAEARVTEFDAERASMALFAHFRHCKQCRDGGYEFGPIENLCAQGQRMRRVAELTEAAAKSQESILRRKPDGQEKVSQETTQTR